MAVIIEANYSKKLGLPAYSSHSYSLTIRAEVADLRQVGQESAKLYALLQGSVDHEIQKTGYVPSTPVDLSFMDRSQDKSETWKCSDKQRELILKIVEEHSLDKQQIDTLAKERFNLPVRALNRLQASGLIEELIEKHPSKRNGGSQRSSYGRGARR